MNFYSPATEKLSYRQSICPLCNVSQENGFKDPITKERGCRDCLGYKWGMRAKGWQKASSKLSPYNYYKFCSWFEGNSRIYL